MSEEKDKEQERKAVVWKTISLPASIHLEIEDFLETHPSFQSKSEVARTALRELFHKYRHIKNEALESEGQPPKESEEA